MAREEIDLKSVKKLNNSGKPKKSYSQNSRFAKTGTGKGKPGGGKTWSPKSGSVKSGSAKSGGEKSSNRKQGMQTGKMKMNHMDVKATGVPEEWLYFQKESSNIELVKQACEALEYDVEFWSELGVIEVNIDEQTSMDFEMLDDYEVDEATTDYVKKNQIQLALIVSVRTDNMRRIKDVMKKITEKTQGEFVVDESVK